MKAKIVVNREFPISPIDPRIYGGFIEHLGRAVYEGIYEPGHPQADKDGFREDVIGLVKELNMPVTRYPGGNFVSGYNWMDGIGPKQDRPVRLDPAWKALEPNQVGVNEFMDWCQKADTSPMMAFNLGTGGVEMARALYEYCNFSGGTHYSELRKSHGYEKPHDIRLWCLGNEMDGPWQMGHKSATEYGALANETAKLIKMIDDQNEFVVCGSSHQFMPEFGKWEAEVLSESFHNVDYLSIHQYYNNQSGDTPKFLSKSEDMDDYIKSVVSCCDYVSAKMKSKKRIMLSFDEWNVWYHSLEQDKQQPNWTWPKGLLEDVYNMEDALLAGSMMITLINNADRVKIGCIAQTVNVIAPIMTAKGGPAWRQTIFWPFHFTSNNGRGEALKQVVSSPTYDLKDRTGVPVLNSAVVHDEAENTVAIFAVNRSLDKELDLSVELQGFGEMKVSEWQVLSHKDLKAVNTMKDPDNVSPEAISGATFKRDVLTVGLPAASWNMIKLAPIAFAAGSL